MCIRGASEGVPFSVVLDALESAPASVLWQCYQLSAVTPGPAPSQHAAHAPGEVFSIAPDYRLSKGLVRLTKGLVDAVVQCTLVIWRLWRPIDPRPTLPKPHLLL